MGIHFLKFIHVLLALGLLGALFCCIVLVMRSAQSSTLFYINKIILALCVFALLTGTLLVYPKHFTFHTPWIQAAYLLLFIFAVGVTLLLLLKKITPRWIGVMSYIFLLMILIFITHDAVMKSTFVLS